MLELWLIAVSTTHYKNVNRQQTKDGRTKALKWYPRLQLNRYLRSILIRVMERKIMMNFYYISINVSISQCGQYHEKDDIIQNLTMFVLQTNCIIYTRIF